MKSLVETASAMCIADFRKLCMLKRGSKWFMKSTRNRGQHFDLLYLYFPFTSLFIYTILLKFRSFFRRFLLDVDLVLGKISKEITKSTTFLQVRAGMLTARKIISSWVQVTAYWSTGIPTFRAIANDICSKETIHLLSISTPLHGECSQRCFSSLSMQHKKFI